MSQLKKGTCAWTILPGECDDRIIANGTPVVAGAPVVLVHCFTNKRLAAVNVTINTDFGSELGVCVHTYTETGKVNKLMRATSGRPTHRPTLPTSRLSTTYGSAPS